MPKVVRLAETDQVPTIILPDSDSAGEEDDGQDDGRDENGPNSTPLQTKRAVLAHTRLKKAIPDPRVSMAMSAVPPRVLEIALAGGGIVKGATLAEKEDARRLVSRIVELNSGEVPSMRLLPKSEIRKTMTEIRNANAGKPAKDAAKVRTPKAREATATKRPQPMKPGACPGFSQESSSSSESSSEEETWDDVRAQLEYIMDLADKGQKPKARRLFAAVNASAVPASQRKSFSMMREYLQ